jgi:flagellar assembly protein FliH
MSWSKVYRGLESCTLKPHRFAEFGPDGKTLPPTEPPRPAATFQSPPGQEKVPEKAEAENLEAKLEEAVARGRREGAKEAELRFGKATESLTLAMEEISRLRESLLDNASQDMLSLVITIARQLIHAELSVNSAIILGTIERALQAAVRSDAYHLRVNEEDLAVVTEKKPLFLARISSLKNLTIEADPTVGRGGCRLESDLGEVDATMESQIEVIRRTLSGAVAGTP